MVYAQYILLTTCFRQINLVGWTNIEFFDSSFNHYTPINVFFKTSFLSKTHLLFVGKRATWKRRPRNSEQSSKWRFPRENATLGQVNTTVTLNHKYIYTSLHTSIHTLRPARSQTNVHTVSLSPAQCHTCVHQALIEYLIYSLTNINVVWTVVLWWKLGANTHAQTRCSFKNQYNGLLFKLQCRKSFFTILFL